MHFGVDIRSSFKEFIEVAQKIGQSWHEARREAREGTIPVNLGVHAGRNREQSKKEGSQGNRLSVSLVNKTAVDPNSFVDAAAAVERWIIWVSHILGPCPSNCVGFSSMGLHTASFFVGSALS